MHRSDRVIFQGRCLGNLDELCAVLQLFVDRLGQFGVEIRVTREPNKPPIVALYVPTELRPRLGYRTHTRGGGYVAEQLTIAQPNAKLGSYLKAKHAARLAGTLNNNTTEVQS